MTDNDRAFLEVSLALLREGCGVRFHPGGHSMHPTIRNGEAILIEPVSPSAIRTGDIILYRFERGVIAHRVRRVVEGQTRTFITRGDSSRTDDAPVLAQDVLGCVVSVERDGRKVRLTGWRARWQRRLRLCGGWLKTRFLKPLAVFISAGRKIHLKKKN